MAFGMAGWGFILGAAGLITLITAWVQLAKTSSFAKCSECVTGHVTGKHAHYSQKRRHYSLDVEYTVDGTVYRRSVPASSSEYNTLETGDPLELNYKPDHPKKIMRADHLSAKSVKAVRIVVIISAALTLIGVALFLFGIK